MVASSFDDDAERLVFADQLLAQGDARGELIVTQCELARGGFTRERGIALRKRELELLLAHEDSWANLEGIARNWTFRRGFVDEITIEVSKFVQHEDEIWRRAPYLRWVRLRGLEYDSPVDDLDDASREWDNVRPRLERALESGRLRYLGVEDARVTWMHDGTMSRHRQSGALDDTIARWLMSEPALREQMRGLSFEYVKPVTMRLLDSASLEEIELEGGLFDEVPIEPSPLAPRSVKLRDRQRKLPWDDEKAALKELLAGPFGSRLVALDPFHLEPVLASGCAARLRELRVSPLYDEAIFAMVADAPELANLEHLALDVFPGRQLDLSIEPLYNPKHLDALRTLRFGPGVSFPQAKALLQSKLAQRLELIDLRHSKTQLDAHAEELRGLWDGFLLL